MSMETMEIRETPCRGCRFCVDICPTDVIGFDEETQKASVETVEDCIGCLSCRYICPSGAIEHRGYHVVKNFYRNLYFSRRMERFL
jgi:ferredoxin